MPSARYNRKKFLVKIIGFLALSPTLAWASSKRIHTVKRGDTLSEIAQKYNTTVSALKKRNQLKSDLIKVGQKLVVSHSASTIENVIKVTNSIRVNRAKWKYIVVHHSAIDRGNAASYDKNHRRRGMENGLAYHFVIGNGKDSGDGEIEIGNRWLKQLHGGHVKSNRVNQSGIGICLVGNFDEKRPSQKQLQALTELVDYLGNDVLKGKFTFKTHKEIDENHTVCPGRFFPTNLFRKKFN